MFQLPDSCQTVNQLPQAPKPRTASHSPLKHRDHVCDLCGQVIAKNQAKVRSTSGIFYHRTCYKTEQQKQQAQNQTRRGPVGQPKNNAKKSQCGLLEDATAALCVRCECGYSISSDQKHAGKPVTCTHCGRVYRLPSAPGVVYTTEQVCEICGNGFSLQPGFSPTTLGDGRVCHQTCRQQTSMSAMLNEKIPVTRTRPIQKAKWSSPGVLDSMNPDVVGYLAAIGAFLGIPFVLMLAFVTANAVEPSFYDSVISSSASPEGQVVGSIFFLTWISAPGAAFKAARAWSRNRTRE